MSAYKKGHITTFIGKDMYIKGDLHSLGSIFIDGRVEGNIVCQAEVTVSEHAVVKANITAKYILINGEVQGEVESLEGLKINSTGKVFGNIRGDRLIIEEGGVYQGHVNMDVIAAQNIYENKFEFKPQQA